MQALRGFVDAVWKSDESVHHEYSVATVWSKPDTVSKSFELRRLTTGQNKSHVVTDFFELYWAHLMPGTTLGHVLSWARILLVRWPWKVPRALLGVWLLLVVAALAAGFLLLQSVLPEEYVVLAIPKWASGLAGALLTALVIPVINNVVGDAARYLNAAPSNIQRRHEIRVNGVKVLEELHRSGHYERIIVVGQGLGSVIAYDILTYAWALHYRERDDEKPWPLGAQNDLEQMAVAGDIQVDEYQKRQREYLSELRSGGNTWLVTDLLTLGCPLAHAAILLADDRADLERKKDDRELPTCPPVLEDERFSFPPKSKTRVPHHAAVFGPTRWTNLYFPAWLIFWGDIIGGPLRGVFGEGIRDVPVRTSQRLGLFSHTLYWTQPRESETAEHIEKLRRALDLLDRAKPPQATV